jgi:histidine triad (HIT) family protein
MADKTIFKRIIDREIPADIVYEDDLCMAFRDVSPKAPVHVLLIPKKEVPAVDDLAPEDQSLAGHLMLVAAQLARQLELNNGYRLVINCGPDAGQAVNHLHLHILGGRPLGWPPG